MAHFSASPRRPRGAKPRDEFLDKVLDLRRVTRVTAGGKRFRFRVTVIIGDGRGRVGAGIAKGLDVAQAVEKAKADAKKRLITVPLKGRTILHEVEAKFSAARVRLKPAEPGHGLIAGGAVRTVLALAGVKDVTAKCLGRTPNKLTNALATIAALRRLQPSEKHETDRNNGNHTAAAPQQKA
jgi:small subunit ribosomal protein S5